jgi:glycosyltransferase involved in cell wall biosynthesis
MMQKKIQSDYSTLEKELTIVIPAKNEESYIGRILEELSLQRIGKTQIILADAGSTDDTRKIATSTALDLGLNLKIIEGGLPAKGRNSGAKMARTHYVLFVDADVTFNPQFDLSICLDKIKGKYFVVSTTPTMRNTEDLVAVFMLWLNKLISIFLSKTEPFAIGAFTLVDREIFLGFGGYDEEVKHTEDWLFSKLVPVSRFLLIPNLITQDNRRFKRFGYLSMVKLMFINWLNRNNRDYFLKDAGYWS